MRVKCKKCGDIVENKGCRKFWCDCGKVMIDGGNDIIKIAGMSNDFVFVGEDNIEFPTAVQHIIKHSRFGKEGSYTPKISYIKDDLEIKLPEFDYFKELRKRMVKDYDNKILEDIADLLRTKYGLEIDKKYYMEAMRRYDATIKFEVENENLKKQLIEKDNRIKELEEKLTKNKKPYERFLPCTCGCNRRDLWNRFDRYWYKCRNCGLVSESSHTMAGAKRNWNSIIKKGVKR